MKNPAPAVPLCIIADFLGDQGDPPGNELRAVFADNNFILSEWGVPEGVFLSRLRERIQEHVHSSD